jgi:hypothetical protein
VLDTHTKDDTRQIWRTRHVKHVGHEWQEGGHALFQCSMREE